MAQTASELLESIRDKNVIVFDGECVLCSGFFKFVLKNDHRKQFSFIIAQSPAGEMLYEHFGLKADDYDTNMVLIKGVLHERFKTVFAVMKVLGLPWRAISVLKILPSPVLDWLYYRIARNRYHLFGRYDTCITPTSDVKERFID